MLEILPIHHLRDEDALVFGSLNILLGKLSYLNIPIGRGIVVVVQNFKLKTLLEHFDFGSKEVFEQSLTLFQKELHNTPIPQNLLVELKKHQNHFFIEGRVFKSASDVWKILIELWVEQIKRRLWNEGFTKGITENLEPKKIIFVKKISSYGRAEFDKKEDDAILQVIFGKLEPHLANKLEEIIKNVDKKLIVSYQYEWMVDEKEVFLIGVRPFTPIIETFKKVAVPESEYIVKKPEVKSTVKIFLNLSSAQIKIEDFNRIEVDGIFFFGEKIIKSDITKENLEDLMLKLIDAANSFPDKPILFKLPDFSEGMGGVRGSQRLIHNPNVLDAVLEAVVYARFKHQRTLDTGKVHGHNNIHLIIPFVRGVNEFLEIKREMATKKLMRKNSLQLWLELTTPENFVNLEEYLVAGLDGVIINLDEVLSHLLGFDHTQSELTFYKKQISSLIKFMEDGIKLLHKSKISFLVSGNLTLEPEVIEFLIGRGVRGIIVEPYEVDSIHELLGKVEKRVILRRSPRV